MEMAVNELKKEEKIEVKPLRAPYNRSQTVMEKRNFYQHFFK